MNKYISFFIFAITAIITFTGCDNETATIGSSIVPESDIVTAKTSTYYAKSQSVDMSNRILNKPEKMYLGRYTDEESEATFEASFLTQFASGNSIAFPEEGVIDNSALYTKLRLYYDEIDGDKNNTMKCEIYELDKVIAENTLYYTDIDASQYYDQNKEAIATKVYSTKDYTQTSSSDEHSNNIEITLPNEIGTRIIQSYYTTPENFANSEVFINNVIKGIYAKCTQGDGTLLNIYRARLEVAFRHYIMSSRGVKDSIETLVTPFYSNKEILKLNKFDNGDISKLINNTENTYIKTPAGIFTEVELPIKEIVEGCMGDTINAVKIEFASYTSDKKNYKAPSTLLMVRKKDMEEFFVKNKTCDNITSFFAIANNSKRYTFSNIATLIKHCYDEYASGKADSDWQKVMLIPIEAASDSYGNLVKVSHYTKMGCVKLRGGANYKIPVEVISSTFK